ncbi:MAG TPA: FAD-dependent oxidoreductase [Rhizomicrobium sp.]|nr:FAD-dependent oxidoreductase [Rhizomicrobium sp.]
MSQRIVIIGAGQAAAQAVATLRAEGFDGELTVVGDEPFAPYQRPPLSKAYLAGTFERERLYLKPAQFYEDAKCALILDTAASVIDRDLKFVGLNDGQHIPYDKLLLATGSRVRRIRCPGADRDGIHYMRGMVDVDALQPEFKPGARLAVIGGGYIGLEVAAVAKKHGLQVTVFEAMDRLMQRAVTPPISAFYEKVHRDAGVTLMLNTALEAFEGGERIEAVRAGGKSYPVDLALVGIGIVPNQELAQAAGLTCDDGIVVDEFGATSDPAIFAAGDCTKHPAQHGKMVRLECVQNAIDQAKHAALAMLGKPTPYREVPWFWSDQYDLKLQIAGLAGRGDQIVVRGDPATRTFAAFHLAQGAVVAVEAVNAAPEYLIGRKLIAAGTRVAPERLADLAISMKNMA